MYTVISMANPTGRQRYERFISRLSEADRLKFHKTLGCAVQLFPGRWDYSKMLEGQMGCNKSHRKCAQANYGTTIVEDDVIFTGDLTCWEQNIIPFAKSIGADAIYGGSSASLNRAHLESSKYHKVPNCSCGHYVVECNRATGFFMYQLLSLRARNTLLKGPDNVVIDSWFAGQTKTKNMKCLFVVPFMAKCEPCVSNIHQRFLDYSSVIDQREQVFKNKVKIK
jgi:hypothetical protein